VADSAEKVFLGDERNFLELLSRNCCWSTKAVGIGSKRTLTKNVPIRVVAASHNTSVAEIERTYSKFITEHSGNLSRRALLDHQAQLTDNLLLMAA
jgi:hypothetical protein